MRVSPESKHNLARIAGLCAACMASIAWAHPHPVGAAVAAPVAGPVDEPVAGPVAEPVAEPPNRPLAHPLNREDLEAFFDGIIPLQLERSDIAGAAVLVMKDGQTLLQKGYGYRDWTSKRPVDPSSTLFRLASISKLFTWVAAMQLVEQGKLDLDADINRYLDFRIETAGMAKPITLRHLMTHTAGFEETVRNIIVTDDKYYLGLREFLVQNQPHRLFEPGTMPAYSNYGVGLGSYIVQRVSGQRFEDYVASHIFAPLGMSHSTFYQPPPQALEDLPSSGYRSSTLKPAVGFERFSPVGAGGLSSSASDMGRFGSSLLNGGELDGQRILTRQSLETMWRPQFRANEQLPPIGLGFYQIWRNQLHWIGHQGDLIAFHSLFFIEPRNNLVIFASYNSAGSAAKARPELLNAFSDRYFPADQPQDFIKAPLPELKEIEGYYQPTRRADSTMLKFVALLDQRHTAVDKDGVLKSEEIKDLRGHPLRWKPIGKDLWGEIGGQGRLFAIRAADGRIVRLAGATAMSQMQRVPWYEHDHLVFSSLAVSFLIIAAVLIAAILRLARRYLLHSSQPKPRPGILPLTAPAKAAAIYWIIYIAAFAIVFSILGIEDAVPPSSGWDKYFLLGDVLGAIGVALSIAAAAAAVRVWRRPSTPAISRIKFTLVAIASLYFSWFAIHWHLIAPMHRF